MKKDSILKNLLMVFHLYPPVDIEPRLWGKRKNSKIGGSYQYPRLKLRDNEDIKRNHQLVEKM